MNNYIVLAYIFTFASLLLLGGLSIQQYLKKKSAKISKK